jgi:HlyD family secretion protein
MKKILAVAGGAAILVVVLVASLRQASTGRGIKVFMEDAAVRPRLVATVSASGEVRPREEVNISSQVSGQIVDLRVEEGDRVRKGEVLVQLDPERFRSEVLRLEALLRMARVEIEKEQVALRTAESNLRRLEALYAQKIISDDQVEQARLTVDSGRIALKSRDEQVAQAEADLARARDDLSKTTLRAPMEGMVTAVNAKVGEQVIIGTMNNPGTVILTLSDMSEVLAEVRVDETDVTAVRAGQVVEIRVDAVQDATYPGTVEAIGNAAIREGTVSRFPVKVKFERPDERLRPGMSAHASIQVDERTSVVAIPLQALVRRTLKDFADTGPAAPPDSGGGATASESRTGGGPSGAEEAPPGGSGAPVDPEREQVQVVLLEREGKVRMVKVQTGISDAFRVEIIEGIAEGDHVLLGPYRRLRSLKNGDLVQRTERSEFGDEAEDD